MIFYCSYSRLNKPKQIILHIASEPVPPEKFITNEITTLQSDRGCEFQGYIDANDIEHAHLVFRTQLAIQHKIIL